jgi:hypothetical protein
LALNFCYKCPPPPPPPLSLFLSLPLQSLIHFQPFAEDLHSLHIKQKGIVSLDEGNWVQVFGDRESEGGQGRLLIPLARGHFLYRLLFLEIAKQTHRTKQWDLTRMKPYYCDTNVSSNLLALRILCATPKVNLNPSFYVHFF